MKTLFIAIRALVYGSAFMFFWGWLSLSTRVYDQSFDIALPLWMETFGILFGLVGAFIALLCLALFIFRGKGTGAPFDAPREFVAVGPYRYVRNPMYIGGWFMFIGFGLFERSISMIFFSFVWLLLAHLFVVFVEEPGLTKRFASSYLEYKQSVSRWIPGRKPVKRS